MRPGQAAPDENIMADGPEGDKEASMRPGQAAPDELREQMTLPHGADASMRPGQAAPDEPLWTLGDFVFSMLQ